MGKGQGASDRTEDIDVHGRSDGGEGEGCNNNRRRGGKKEEVEIERRGGGYKEEAETRDFPG